MKRVLFITKFAPTGQPFGGMVRTTRLLDALRSRFEVDVLGFVEGGTPAPRSRVSTAFRSFGSRQPYQTIRYDTPWLRDEIRRHLADLRPDAIHVDYLNQAPVVWDLPLPKALDLHNVESALAAGIAASSGPVTRLMAGRDARLLRVVEQRAAASFQLITAPSHNEALRMPGDVEVVVNGVDPARRPLDVAPDPDVACFVGVFSWAPNIDGAVWLVENVLPLLPQRIHLKLVGRNPHRRVQALAGPRVDVTGEVPDTWPYVSGASVVLAPLLTRGGTRHKILEGLLAERPVVATPEAADGLEDLVGDGLVLASDPAGFATSVLELAEDPARVRRMGQAGRQAVIERYSWDASCARLLDLYEERFGLF